MIVNNRFEKMLNVDLKDWQNDDWISNQKANNFRKKLERNTQAVFLFEF